MLRAVCAGVPSPCAPSTSEKGFMSSGTSARCDLPSEPLYTRNILGMSARRRGGLGQLPDHPGLVHGRRVDLEHFQVVRAVELVVHDGRRLQHAIALGEGVLALTLVDELDPAVEHVEHLEVTEVLVQARRVQLVLAGRVLLDPDDVGAELSVRRVVDAEIAVFHETAKTSLVHRVLGQVRAEELLRLAHGLSSMSDRLVVPIRPVPRTRRWYRPSSP